MLERFSDDARRAVALAEGEARGFGHAYIGTEHLLLGILAGGESRAAGALMAGGATLDGARQKVAEVAGPGRAEVEDPDLSDRARRALERASRLSVRARASEVGTEHLLLAVLDVEGRAGQVLRSLSVDLAGVRSAVEPTEQTPPQSPPSTSALARPVRCPACGGDLQSQLAHTTIISTGDGGATQAFLVSYCGSCHAAVGSAPAAPT